MSDRIAEVVILAEDDRATCFFRRYVERAVNPRRIRVEHAPRGRGSGADWVIQKYPREVAVQRRRVGAKSPNIAAIVVHVDADTSGVVDRHAQLADALKTASARPRGAAERIAITVPKRHVETWLHGLCGTPVDEDYDFKRDPERRIPGDRERLCDQRIRPAATQLYELTRVHAPAPPATMPSVATAVPELRRLE